MEEYILTIDFQGASIGGPGAEPMVFSGVLGQVAPIIVDLITIYSDNKEVKTLVSYCE
jgi:hypothetical protein